MSQAFLDGMKSWGGQLVNATGQAVADNIAPAEKQVDPDQPEMESGPQTPNQKAAASLPFQLAEAKTMMLVGGAVLGVVAVVAMLGARK